MTRKEILQRAYEILENVTPLRLDCGSLCDRACCLGPEGEDEDRGMLLFPGEEEFFEDCSDWMTLKPAAPIYPNQVLAVCKGTCPRNRRPLACRIYPLTPYLTEDNILLIKMDPRAAGQCPLTVGAGRRNLQPEFIKAVRKVSRLLLTEPSLSKYITSLSRMLDEYVQDPLYLHITSL
jgi:hypothetical protein